MTQTWIIGAGGRLGRRIADELHSRGTALVLVDLDAGRLAEQASDLATKGGVAPETLVGDDIAAQIAEHRPSVVVNTVGPFTRTGGPTARACVSAGAHYIDMSNEYRSVRELLELHDDAVRTGVTVVTAAGFGGLATEALTLELTAGQPAPVRVEVANMPLTTQIGPALVASVLEAAQTGGLEYRGGKLLRTRLGSNLTETPLPDGTTRKTVAVPMGELEGAFRAAGAQEVVARSSDMPTGFLARSMMPVVGTLLRSGRVRRLALRMAQNNQPAPRSDVDASWAHARVHWDNGERRSAWLNTGESYEYTARVTAIVAARLAAGDVPHGAYTPGALFGPDIAREAGATITIGVETTPSRR
ncbi:saccharopine dehydrogenase NADP-binding domain-containing protein [Nocardia nova]|uniref:saccharopine dehydrogenase NADP-binding domain-containing protein n=1 Tax=Nocardia nova TaxID=37330 RepID=UPI0033F526E5